MSDNELDQILSGEHEIVPTSDFKSNVMAALQREASIPPPIPFPWKWALPGLAAAVFIFVLFAIAALAPHQAVYVPPPLLTNALLGVKHMGLEWIALGLLLTLVSVKLGRFTS